MAAVVGEATAVEAAAVGVIEHSILPQCQEAFSTGLLDRPSPIFASSRTSNRTDRLRPNGQFADPDCLVVRHTVDVGRHHDLALPL